jgi:hypothetical protein
MSPGGVGVDIKHNSYDRFLNRLKGKAPLRRGVIVPNFGEVDIPFNRANPVYGGKVLKTSIVTGCNCPIENSLNYKKLYTNNYDQNYDFNVNYKFSVGQKIFIYYNNKYVKATILSDLGNNNFSIQIINGPIITLNSYYFLIYYNCGSHVNYVSEHYPYSSIQNNSGLTDTYIAEPGNVVACAESSNGIRTNISNSFNFFPEITNALAINSINNSLQFLQDNGIWYVNGQPINIYNTTFVPPEFIHQCSQTKNYKF